MVMGHAWSELDLIRRQRERGGAEDRNSLDKECDLTQQYLNSFNEINSGLTR